MAIASHTKAIDEFERQVSRLNKSIISKKREIERYKSMLDGAIKLRDHTVRRYERHSARYPKALNKYKAELSKLPNTRPLNKRSRKNK